MDNCFLEKLLAKPGKLFPKFNKNLLNYNIILGVSDNKTVLDFFTEDSGASYQIYTEGGDGTKTINVDEGTTKTVKIDVTAEDGRTTKCYIIEIKRHSSKAAIIESLSISIGTLEPNFISEHLEYYATIGLKSADIAFNINLPDNKAKVKINNEELKPQYSLTLGYSIFNINVTSPDGSNNQIYKIKIWRKPLSLYIFLTNPLDRLMYEDPISLSPCFYPIVTKVMNSWDILTKCETVQLINLNKSDFQVKVDVDDNLERTLSSLDGQILRPNLTLSDSMIINNLGTVMGDFEKPAPLVNMAYSFYPFNENINLIPEWQQNMAILDSKENDDILMKNCEEAIKTYLKSRPSKPLWNTKQIFDHNHPSKLLFNAVKLAASAINKKKSTSKYHLILAQLLEENYLNQDLFNLILHKTDSEGKGNQGSVESAGRDTKAVFTAKQEEIMAICKIHGYGNNATTAEQMMALDKEYHNLIAQNQSSRADAIQNLYEWKSKQASQEANMHYQANNEETPIGQAFNKYQAALSIDKNSHLNNFHVGRLLIIQGKYKEAIERFQTALSSKNNHLPSKLCLGLAMSLVTDVVKDKINDGIFLIYDSLSNGLGDILEEMESNVEIPNDKYLWSADEMFFNIKNPLISKSIFQLGKMLLNSSQTKITIKPSLIFHWALQMAALGWSQIGTGNSLVKFETTIIECHKELLNFIHEEIDSPSNSVYINRCLWLLSFIKLSSISIRNEMLQLLEEICQVPLYYDPSNQYFLRFYGEILSRKADEMIVQDELFSNTIELSIKILHMALDVKKDNKIDAATKFIKGLPWYNEKNLIIFKAKPPNDKQKQPDNKVAESEKTSTIKSQPKPVPNKAPVAVAKKNIPPPTKKGPIKLANVANKSAPPNKEMEANKIKTESKEESIKLSVKEEKVEPKYTRSLAKGILFDEFGIELSLARAYRINKQLSESVIYYRLAGIHNHITTINDISQEYIEALISAEDYNSALKVYYNFPINLTNPSFDDGYICGEVVGLLMKTENYKDKMLVKYASLWAKIFGFGIIEKEITTLESKGQTDICKEIYATVHGKKVDDPDLNMFFQSKCWV